MKKLTYSIDMNICRIDQEVNENSDLKNWYHVLENSLLDIKKNESQIYVALNNIETKLLEYISEFSTQNLFFKLNDVYSMRFKMSDDYEVREQYSDEINKNLDIIKKLNNGLPPVIEKTIDMATSFYLRNLKDNSDTQYNLFTKFVLNNDFVVKKVQFN